MFQNLLVTLSLIISLTFGCINVTNASETHHYQFALVTYNSQMMLMRTSQVKMLYRGRLSNINGIATRLMDLPKNSAYRNQFYQALLNKNPAQMSAIWAKQSFSGRAIAPFEIKNESKIEIINWLKNNKNGVAYVPTHLIPEDAYVIYQM